MNAKRYGMGYESDLNMAQQIETNMLHGAA